MAKEIKELNMPRLCNKPVKFEYEIYEYADELYKELESKGIMDRLSDIPHLGVINVKKCLKKTRMDYVVIQLYLHTIMNKNIAKDLKYTYGNLISLDVFSSGIDMNGIKKKPSMADVLQILCIVYNIGHFYNTFTSSQAVIIYTKEDKNFRNMIVNSFKNELFRNLAAEVLDDENYQRFHLINSLLILEKCDNNKLSVKLAQGILYSYLNKNDTIDEKLMYVFKLFKAIRNVSYIAMDLPIAEASINFDISEKGNITTIFREMISEYNNNEPLKNLIAAVQKLLNDTIYNEPVNSLCHFQITKAIYRKLKKDNINSYYDLFCSKESILNMRYKKEKKFISDNILKLTFKTDEIEAFKYIFNSLKNTNGIKIGYYDRYTGEKTILISVMKNNQYAEKISLKVLKTIVTGLRKTKSDNSDVRYLLGVKFFLYFLFNKKDKRDFVINPTINKDICVICARGRSSRVKAINDLIVKNIGTEDQCYEAKFIKMVIERDNVNDTAIIIPASIIVKGNSYKKECEFDGLVIFPFRKYKQVVFFEAKNKKTRKSKAKKELYENLCNIDCCVCEDEIYVLEYSAYVFYSIS